MSNLIPITRIYDIYPKYTYSNDVKKFMDEIVDIDRANVFTEADMVDILDKIRAEIEQTTSRYCLSKELFTIGQMKWSDRLIKESEVLEIIDKYKAESEE